MDISTLLGVIVGFGGILIGYVLEGGSIPSLWGLSAFIIIVFGTVGAITISFSLKDVMNLGNTIGECFAPANGPNPAMADSIIEMAEKARREGLLALDDQVEDIEDPLFKKGIRMVVDGVDPEEIEKMLEADISIHEHHKKEQIAILEAAGGFSPTMGIIGTVTGLVLVLGNLGGDAGALGHAIAAAFIATLYGIGLANLVWLPMANKLKYKLRIEKLRMEMTLTGVFSIHKGESPVIVEEKMNAYLSEKRPSKNEVD